MGGEGTNSIQRIEKEEIRVAINKIDAGLIMEINKTKPCFLKTVSRNDNLQEFKL